MDNRNIDSLNLIFNPAIFFEELIELAGENEDIFQIFRRKFLQNLTDNIVDEKQKEKVDQFLNNEDHQDSVLSKLLESKENSEAMKETIIFYGLKKEFFKQNIETFLPKDTLGKMRITYNDLTRKLVEMARENKQKLPDTLEDDDMIAPPPPARFSGDEPSPSTRATNKEKFTQESNERTSSTY